MKAFDITGYTFQARIVCPVCVADALNLPLVGEEHLTVLAESLGIDRMDENTFDSDDFPKVIFATDTWVGETCSDCDANLFQAFRG